MSHSKINKLAVLLLILFLTLLSACGVADRKPSSIDYVKNKAALNKTADRTKYVKRELFLSDARGLLVPQSIGLPETKEPLKQVLNYLVDDGPVSNILPNGFQAVLPPGTEVRSVHVDASGNLTADFSKELLDASSDSRDQIVQSIVWTATQFENVKSVTLRVAGEKLTQWPKTGEEIGTGLTRTSGINQNFDQVTDVAGSQPVNVYYLYVEKGKSFNVPVTVRVSSQGNEWAAMVQALIHEPEGSDFISALNPDTQLISRPYIKNGIVYLHFNQAIYEDKASKTISDQALRSLVLTLTGTNGINKVSIKVGQSSKMTLESGTTISGPVSRTMVTATGL
ncbi:GerMN domain-containing protein [Sporolactobacillus spathodeae]|uniref:Germination protein M n=1 Tax=Sporolactobacillus spathodeae TaxID=1465502 RepID=A0ABS2Q8F7_9BACL|nr:GerMN domain-containing protein [Sporolactobacillus spathodeae]MBM7658033.1 germination protein M [Sporolactobacillus spathodeae]